MKRGAKYVPKRGDAVWLDFDPQTGQEQAGRRPALVLSPEEYNRKTGLAVFCPITNRGKGYPFEVAIPDGLKATGFILSDHVKNLDWRARNAQLICELPEDVVVAALEKVNALLDPEE